MTKPIAGSEQGTNEELLAVVRWINELPIGSADNTEVFQRNVMTKLMEVGYRSAQREAGITEGLNNGSFEICQTFLVEHGSCAMEWLRERRATLQFLGSELYRAMHNEPNAFITDCTWKIINAAHRRTKP